MSKRNALVSTMILLVMLSMMSFMSVSAQDEEPTATLETLPTATPAVESIGSGGLEISFWNGLTGSDGVTLNAMLADFVAEHPEISVTTEIVEWGTLYTKLQTAFIAGEGPDMFLVHANEVPQFASYGVLTDLSGWYDTGGGTIPADDFAQPGFDGAFYNGTVYGVELDNHGRGAWVNVDHFEAAGLDPNTYPENYEETVAMLQQLTLDANGNNAASEDFDPENIVQYGTTVSEWIYVQFLQYMWGMGGDLLSEDKTTATINSPEAVEALQRMYDLIYTYHVAPVPAGFDTWQAFSTGAISILPTGTWFRNFAEDQTDINSQPWPVLPIGDQRVSWFGSHIFLVPNTTTGEKLDAVRTLIEWVTENQVMWAASGQVPARLSAQQQLDPENYPSNILIGQTFTEYGRMSPQCQVILELEDAIGPELDAALNDLKTPQQALDDAAARMQQVLDRTSC
ncbi:ABC transporter substrate-binding protein [Phototrophicus methaneseepsis]|uniref:ABC transporter substrate-binding protein n=1 Tax=Phototrophicus methaneseepsis TaxID=2710758 RepID=A0A7S8EBW1_9CHLR|nr:ABC transporter substrate-binding protein [Phototrophicus methaneseepsis]QPC84125.1 ABC transporter substrate-binding protein [Phototrophicus methaneseepsis]